MNRGRAPSNGAIMTERDTALLVHDKSMTLTTLKAALECQGIRVREVSTCAQAKRWLGGFDPAPLVFTDTQMPDGTWADVLRVAEKCRKAVNVIVVSRIVDTRFYVQAIETGAFDFLAPPFNSNDLAYVVRNALDNAVARRTAPLGGARGAMNGVPHEVGDLTAPSASN